MKEPQVGDVWLIEQYDDLDLGKIIVIEAHPYGLGNDPWSTDLPWFLVLGNKLALIPKRRFLKLLKR